MNGCVLSDDVATSDLDGAVDCRVLLQQICIGEFAGLGIRFAPDAIADYSLLDALRINELSISQFLTSLIYLYSDRINEHWAFRHRHKMAIAITKGQVQYFHFDC